jgi:hypothetical protein
MSTREQEFIQKMEKLVEQAPENRHSYFQLKYFVIGKEPTLQAQMWQCLRELQSRKEAMDGLTLEMEDMKDQIELLDIEKEKGQMELKDRTGMGELDRRKAEVELRRLDRQQVSLQNTLVQLDKRHKFAMQEARFFVQAFESLEKIEPMKDRDDLDAQQEYWNEVIEQKINLKMLLKQPLDTELVQTALALHDNAPIKVQITQMLDRIELQLMSMKERQKLERGGNADKKVIDTR